MPDIMTSIGTIVETVKKLREIGDKIKNADIRNAVADLNMTIADFKDEVVRLRDDNRRLEQELSQLKSARKPAGSIREGAYFPEGDTRPHCVRCFHNSGHLIPLDEVGNAEEVFGKYKCSLCGKFTGPSGF